MAHLRYQLEYFGLRVWRLLLSPFGIKMRHHLAVPLGCLFYYLIPFRKQVVLSNLRHAFPEHAPGWHRRIARRCYVNVTRFYCDFLPLFSTPDRYLRRIIQIADTSALDRALAQGKGVLLVLYHYGNWELLGDWLARQGYPFAAVAKTMKNRQVDQVITTARQSNGVQLFFKKTANSPRIWKYIRAGRVLCLIGDQDARRHGVFVRFFNRWASTHRGAALFAVRLNVPIVVGYCLWQAPGCYRLQLESFDTTIPDGFNGDSVVYLTQKIAAYYEGKIRQHPEQYYWLHRRWKTSPPPSLEARDV